MSSRPLIAGNWKMHGLKASAVELQRIIAGTRQLADVDVMVCPPATLLAEFAATALGSRVAIGCQDCHPLPAGAHTGDVSAEMLKDAGAVAVIVGHSERRHDHGESDELVRAKTLAARRAGLTAIVCVGETREQRDGGEARHVVGGQLERSLPDDVADFIVAYEPVWAIGSGVTPTPQDVADMHGFIRQCLAARYGGGGQGTRILYGGSVKPNNAAQLMAVANVNGALVGGASLHANEFLAITGVYR